VCDALDLHAGLVTAEALCEAKVADLDLHATQTAATVKNMPLRRRLWQRYPSRMPGSPQVLVVKAHMVKVAAHGITGAVPQWYCQQLG
jgi:hypothetical protein